MVLVELDQDVCRKFSTAIEKEWLETNGLGGFSCSTIYCAHTRRYHGLLTASLAEPRGRFVLLSKLEETLEIRGEVYPLSCNIYFNAVHPDGFTRLEMFLLDPFPLFIYKAGGVEITKRIMMIHGENTVIVSYHFRGIEDGAPVRFTVRPLLAFRDYHCLTHSNDKLDRTYRAFPGRLAMKPYVGMPELFLHHAPCNLEGTGYWYRNFEYPHEAHRGLDYREDLFNPVELSFTPVEGERLRFAATLDPIETYPFEERIEGERERRKRVLDSRTRLSGNRRSAMLHLAADSFIAQKGGLNDGYTVVAGYPWFGDWGRDTLIALAGLTLCSGQSSVARDILDTFVRHIRDGLVPNFFDERSGDAVYNTVDASLWFIQAVYEYANRTGDYETVKSQYYQPVKRILKAYEQGTRYNIRIDKDGLVRGGEPGSQLTWMDAKVGDWTVTPRQGKPVEVNALWYNALKVAEIFAQNYGLDGEAAKFREKADRTFASFNLAFWNLELGCCYDCIDGSYRDPSIRPNQLFAISLPFPVLERDKWESTLQVVETHLLTPYGLRTLSASDPRFAPRYEGNQSQRDSAYHQGTVWPWLIGPFITAMIKATPNNRWAKIQDLKKKLEPLLDHLEEAGLGTISEIYDGNPPHRPRGCISQAWSVAEVLRVLYDHLGEP